MSQALYGIAFAREGGPPSSSDPIVSWHPELYLDRREALEVLESLGWTGYVAEYPSGERRHPYFPREARQVINVGDRFTFHDRDDGRLRLVFVVLELLDVIEPPERRARTPARRVITRVLVLDVTELAGEFRAQPGQTTTWAFNLDDPEWQQLRRVS